jgi:hypothetical protein
MTGIKRRIASLEARHGGPQRTFTTVLPLGLTESEQDAFVASERKRLGVGENDCLHLVRTGVSHADDAKWKGVNRVQWP